MSTQEAIWDIKGVDRETGEPRSTVVRAETEKLAIAQANFMVSETARRAAPKQRKKTGPDKSGAATNAPPYRALETLGGIMFIVGGLTMVLSVSAFLLIAVTGQSQGISPLYVAAACLPFFLGGLITTANGQALHALRDIARNSFK